MNIQQLMPELLVRETKPKKRAKQPGIPTPRPSKYDHWQMLQDRIAGMTWPAIAEKHGIKSTTTNKAATLAYHLAINSAVASKLKPHEVEKITKP